MRFVNVAIVANIQLGIVHWNWILVFDACAGPSLGTHSISNYIDNAVDHSTENERLNGFYSDVIPGRIVPLSSYFRIR